MGLDMYLFRKTYIYQGDYVRPEYKWEISITRGGESTHINPENIDQIREEVGYWRKFNALHLFIVNNFANGVDNCEPIFLGGEELEMIVDVLKRVIDNPSSAPELLPTGSGFFFGSTEYDTYYFSDLRSAFNTFSKALEDLSDADYYYQASW